MALFRRKKKDDEPDTAETEAVSQEDAERSEEATAVHSTASTGGSFIPEGGADEQEEEVAGETAEAVKEAAERAEERRAEAAAPEPEKAQADGQGESPREAQRRGEGLPEAEVPGGRASAIRETPPATEAPPAPEHAPRESPLGAQQAVEPGSAMKPELAVGVAFAGGFLLAQLIKWMGGDEHE